MTNGSRKFPVHTIHTSTNHSDESEQAGTLSKGLQNNIIYCFTAQVLKVCRTRSPTACFKIKMLDVVVNTNKRRTYKILQSLLDTKKLIWYMYYVKVWYHAMAMALVTEPDYSICILDWHFMVSHIFKMVGFCTTEQYFSIGRTIWYFNPKKYTRIFIHSLLDSICSIVKYTHKCFSHC